MKICRVNEMREMDQRAITEFGIAQELLMENAGEATYFVIKDIFGPEKKSVNFSKKRRNFLKQRALKNSGKAR